VFASADFFVILAFFEKNLTNAPLLERFQKMDPDLGAMDYGAELTCHGALDLGAEMVQFLASVCERGVRCGQGLGALIRGTDLGALICGAELPSTWARPFLPSP
jgi:hypothetical protein